MPRAGRHRLAPPDTPASRSHSMNRENAMGKYFLGWLLGIPAVVLLALYFFFG